MHARLNLHSFTNLIRSSKRFDINSSSQLHCSKCEIEILLLIETVHMSKRNFDPLILKMFFLVEACILKRMLDWSIENDNYVAKTSLVVHEHNNLLCR